MAKIFMFLSCFISVSAFLSAKLKFFLCFFFKSLVIILVTFCRSNSTTLNFPSRSKSNAQISAFWIMSMYGLFLYSVSTNLGPIFKSFILFSCNSFPLRFTTTSLIIDAVVSIGICKCSVVFFKLFYLEIKC